MKKIFFTLALLSIFCLSYAQKINVKIDYRSTALVNSAIDIYQTYEFRRDGEKERNPMFSWFVNNNNADTVLVASVGFTLLVDHLIQKQPKDRQDLYYALWSAGHIWAILDNRTRGSKGYPVIIPIIKIKF